MYTCIYKRKFGDWNQVHWKLLLMLAEKYWHKSCLCCLVPLCVQFSQGSLRLHQQCIDRVLPPFRSYWVFFLLCYTLGDKYAPVLYTYLMFVVFCSLFPSIGAPPPNCHKLWCQCASAVLSGWGCDNVLSPPSPSFSRHCQCCLSAHGR